MKHIRKFESFKLNEVHHRVSTAREEKGWGRRFFRHIEPN